MKAAGWGFEEIDATRVVLVDGDGSVVSGAGQRHLESMIHTMLLRMRADIGAVVHTHSPAAIAFASLDTALRPLSHDAVPFLDPDVVRFTATSNLISSPELGKSLATAIGGSPGCLIPGHGMVTVGVDAATAVMYAVLLERACRLQLDAMAAGGPVIWTSTDDVALKQATLWTHTQLQAGYEYLIRRADALYGTRSEPQ